MLQSASLPLPEPASPRCTRSRGLDRTGGGPGRPSVEEVVAAEVDSSSPPSAPLKTHHQGGVRFAPLGESGERQRGDPRSSGEGRRTGVSLFVAAAPARGALCWHSGRLPLGVTID